MTEATTAGLAAGTREAVRDLILVLADSKRLLGFRYAEWMLGAPELESGIACSSMAQDEWGHARLLYALLKDFGDDVDGLEHGREPGDYRNMSVLDDPAEGWPEVVALMTLADVALSFQFEALRSSSWEPLRQRVEKLLEEEKFHAAHGVAWFRRLAEGSDASRAVLRRAVTDIVDPVLLWFGPAGGRSAELAEAGVVSEAGPALRERFVERVAPLLALVDAKDALDEASRRVSDDLSSGAFDEARRRSGGGGPDAATIERIRGDRNRAFLMD